MRRLLETAARLALNHPWPVVGLTLLPTLALGLYGLTVPLDLTFTGIMDRSNPEVARYIDMRRRYDLGGNLILLLEGPEDRLEMAVRALVLALEEHPSVRWVSGSDPTEWLRDRAPWMVPREVFDAWIRLVAHPEDQTNALWLAERLGEYQAEMERRRVEGARLLQVVLTEDPLDLALGEDLFFEIQELTDATLVPTGVAGSFSGLPAIAAQDQTRTLSTIRRLSPLSLLFVLILFRFIERRWAGLLAVLIPMVLAVGATVGLMGFLTGKLTVMETFFGVTVFGLGIDFAVHLLVRQREEQGQGRDFRGALLVTWPGAGRGILAGAFTTAGAFFIAALAPDPVAVHLGLSGGIGLSLCLVLMLTLLPAFWALLERTRRLSPAAPTPGAPLTRAVFIPFLATVVRHATSKPRLYLAGALVLLTLALSGTPRFHFETDLQKVFNRHVPALGTVARVQELFGLNGAPWITGVATLEQARQITAEFEAHPLFARVESAAVLFLDDIEDRRLSLEAVAAQVEDRIRVVEAAVLLAPAAAVVPLSRLLEALKVLQRARTLGPPTVENLPPDLGRRLVGPNGEYLVLAYSGRPTLDGVEAAHQRRAAQAIHPEATALGALLEVAMAWERPYVWPIFCAILAFVALVLFVDLRRIRLVLLALVPVLLGTGVTFGALCWMGIGFNVMTVMVVPLIIGLGVDDGIHVVHRIKEDPTLPVDRAATSVGTAIVMTTATTCSSFFVLLFTDHPGLESMALVMLVGLPTCLLASVTTLPALAVLLGTRSVAPAPDPV